ncbi:hypothetical protein [Streptomyces shenzhenensis]|uniref:hypothetical protein n=1 Tax=Streptomyces shenzhenensis TaxID=943815 RepID=UPI0036A826D5
MRHRNASIGHATSTDCITWTDHGTVLEHGPAHAPDASATWTGSVIQDDSGLWRMYYTGAHFPQTGSSVNRETILMATSTDLHHWAKDTTSALAADPTWYETLADATWHEEAWRDPWIVPDPAGTGWHMLITARARHVPPGTDPRDQAVIGHATSTDLTGEELYAGRLVQTKSGPVLLGFENLSTEGEFVGRISDPIPLQLSDDGRLSTARQRKPRSAGT